jgi:hypothetical protein
MDCANVSTDFNARWNSCIRSWLRSSLHSFVLPFGCVLRQLYHHLHNWLLSISRVCQVGPFFFAQFWTIFNL